ncbi:MAG: hypothetical protein PHH36_02630 [Sideroxydans sp.]|nr:hypothetical protein [Sideroxydans sp.]
MLNSVSAQALVPAWGNLRSKLNRVAVAVAIATDKAAALKADAGL